LQQELQSGVLLHTLDTDPIVLQLPSMLKYILLLGIIVDTIQKACNILYNIEKQDNKNLEYDACFNMNEAKLVLYANKLL
jgi:hypothetical protein